GDVVSVVERWIYQAAPHCAGGGGGIDLVCVIRRGPISVFAIDVTDVDHHFTGQLGSIAGEPLPNITLVALGIERSAGIQHAGAGCHDGVQDASVGIVIDVGLSRSVGPGDG